MHNQYGILIGGSAGSIPVVRKILNSLPSNYSLPIIICLHRMKNAPEGIRDVLAVSSNIKIIEPNDKDPICNPGIYLAPANYHLLIEKDLTLSLSTSETVNYSRPSIDVTFISGASAFKNRLSAILLTGANKDGVDGISFVKLNGGTTIVQDPKECQAPYMPLSAIATGNIDLVLSTKEIINYVREIPSKVFP